MSLLGKSEYTFDRTVRLGIAIAWVAIMFWVLRYLSTVLVPFAIASGVAYLLTPIVGRIEQWCKRRWIAVFSTLGLVFAFMFAVLVFATPEIGSEIRQFAKLIREMGEQSEIAKQASQRLPPDLWRALREVLKTPEVRSWVQSQEGIDFIRGFLTQVTPSFLQVLKGTGQFFSAVLGGVVILMYLVFILLDYPRLLMLSKQMIPPSFRGGVKGFVKEFDELLSQYFRAQTMVASAVAVLFSIGFAMIGLPLPALLGVLMGVLNLIPYLQILGMVPVIFLALVQALETGSSFGGSMINVALVFMIVQGIQDGVLVPKIMGDASGLPPAIMLLALSVWGKVLGLLGLMLAIPFTCLCITFYHRWILSTEQAHQDEPSPLEVQSGDEEHGAQDHLEKTNDDTKDLN